MTLLAIFAFIALTLGSFIWYVATWETRAQEPVSQTFGPTPLPKASDLSAHANAFDFAFTNGTVGGTVGGAHLLQANSGARPSYKGAQT